MGFTNTAGYLTSLQEGFAHLDIYSVVAENGVHPFGYKKTVNNPWLVKLNNWCAMKRGSERKVVAFSWMALFLLIRFFLFVWAVIKFDVFIFTSNTSFFKMRDLRILKFFKKKIIVIYTGSDTRPVYINGIYINDEYLLDTKDLLNKAMSQVRKIRKTEMFADYIINNPASAQFHKNKFINWFSIGIPMARHISRPNDVIREKPKIIHAPSNIKFKGTIQIREIIQRLIKSGLNIDYTELTSIPNQELLEQLSACDLLVDQLYSDTPLAGLSSEAALLGVPSIVGGYYAPTIRQDNFDVTLPPNEFVHPDQFEETIRKMIDDKEHRVKIGEMTKEFIQTNWCPDIVAQKFLKLINDEVPKEWYYNPSDISYIHGGGVSEERLRKVMPQIIEKHGEDSLLLDHNPKLLIAIRKLIN